MPKSRKPARELIDLVPRIKSNPSSTLAHMAVAAIGRLKDDGHHMWGGGSKEFKRWARGCDLLWTFLNSEMGERRFQKKESLEVALTDFIHEWEHDSARLREMIRAKHIDSETQESTLKWLEFTYHLSITAIVSYWTHEHLDSE